MSIGITDNAQDQLRISTKGSNYTLHCSWDTLVFRVIQARKQEYKVKHYAENKQVTTNRKLHLKRFRDKQKVTPLTNTHAHTNHGPGCSDLKARNQPCIFGCYSN